MSVVQVLAKPAVQAVLAARVLLAGHLQALLLAGLAASAPGSAVLLETDLPQPHLQPPPRVLLQAGLCLVRALPPGAGAPRTGALRPLGTLTPTGVSHGTDSRSASAQKPLAEEAALCHQLGLTLPLSTPRASRETN